MSGAIEHLQRLLEPSVDLFLRGTRKDSVMTHDIDLVVRNGMLFDGQGGAPFEADVAIASGRVFEVGKVAARGREEIDARGLAVTPGFVDIHTHYDGQVTWENRLQPSSSHGVTTVVMGNCGVGFAPCGRDQHDQLIKLMEGVEDIPHPVLVDGVPWQWETFPEYLDFLAGRKYDMDICGYVPHAALRVYVMGQRGAEREPATAEDLAAMAEHLQQAMAAGAMGLSTSRTFLHRSSDGKSIPTYGAAERELTALALALKRAGSGALQLIADFHEGAESAFGVLRRVAEASRRPLSFTLVEGVAGAGAWPWREILDWIGQANDDGLRMKGQVIGRAIGLLFSHELTLNPFFTGPTYRELARLPFAERIAQLRQPGIRARVLADPVDRDPANALGRMVSDFERVYPLGDPPEYEPDPQTSIAARARRLGLSPAELAYDLLLECDGHRLLYSTFANYAAGSLDACLTMMKHRGTVLGLGDGGAHCGTICDGSAPTFMLTHWSRDRARGERLPLPWIVKALARDTALTVGLHDRGLIAPGYKADINVIDLDRLHLHAPEVVYDLPTGGRRLVQRAEGYAATIVSGGIVHRDGQPTGALPGRLVRGPQAIAAH
jgi:N-acyl-D-aspartate/D-glutamate deacylase